MRRWGLTGCFVALGLLALMCARTDALRISAMLETNIGQQLAHAGMPTVTADADGRFITLSGAVPTQADKNNAIELATAQAGVVSVDDNMSITGPVAAYYTGVTLAQNKVILTGSVPDEEARQRIITAIGVHLPASASSDQVTIVDELVLRDNPPLHWENSMSAAVSELGSFRAATIELNDDNLQIRGQVDSALTVNAIVAAVAGNTPDDVKKQFDISAPEPAQVSGTTTASSTTTTDQTTLTETDAAQRTEAIPNSTGVSSQITSNSNPTPAAPQSDANQAVAKIGPASTSSDSYITRYSYDGAGVVLEGFAPSAQDRDWLVKQVMNLVGVESVSDELSIINDPIAGWREAMTAVHKGAAYYDHATITLMSQAISVLGTAKNEPTRDFAQAMIAGELPAGYAANFSIGVNNQAAQDVRLSASTRNCQDSLNELIAGQVVLFETARHALSDAGVNMLDNVVNILADCPNAGITIAGWADPRGNEDYNMKLSERRAQSVHDYMVQRGIQNNRLEAIGRGETFELGSDDDDYLSRSRRVEFILGDR